MADAVKLICLPGLDGTAKLFAPLRSHLSDIDMMEVSYPVTGKQDYRSLANHVERQLPDEPATLLAESFSGPIGMELLLAPRANIKAVIFVASFLSPPNFPLLLLAPLLPLKLMLKLPFSAQFQRMLLLGTQADDQLVQMFESAVSGLPSATIRARLKAIRSLSPPSAKVDVPALYIQAKDDFLVPKKKISDFKNSLPDLETAVVDGPHFILQANPKRCAKLISAFIDKNDW
ncbi:MAG: alpha/beta hydrolase [Pseudomonadota bacterium]